MAKPTMPARARRPLSPALALLASLAPSACGCASASSPSSPSAAALHEGQAAPASSTAAANTSPAAPAASNSASTAGSAQAPSGPAPSLCDLVTAHDVSARAGDVNAGGASAPPPCPKPHRAAFCFPTPKGGAWASWLTWADASCEGPVRFHVVYLERREGAVARDDEGNDYEAGFNGDIHHAQIADLDGDGEPELSYRLSWQGPEGGSSETLQAFTHKGQQTMRFDLPAGVSRLEDDDHDGVLDAFVDFAEDDRLACPGYLWEPAKAPTLLGHGKRSGGFSFDDALAKAHAKKVCPTRPSRIVAMQAKSPRLVDEEQTAKNVVCARAWGMSPQAVVTALGSGCSEFSPRDSCEDKTARPRECRHRPLLERWATVAPSVLGK